MVMEVTKVMRYPSKRMKREDKRNRSPEGLKHLKIGLQKDVHTKKT
jgi:hypothetical protein